MNTIRLLFILFAAAIFSVNAVSPASAQAQRKNVTALTAVELQGLRRGVAVMMSRNTAPRDSADFRRSWAYWANVHAHFGFDCAGPVPTTARGIGSV